MTLPVRVCAGAGVCVCVCVRVCVCVCVCFLDTAYLEVPHLTWLAFARSMVGMPTARTFTW